MALDEAMARVSDGRYNFTNDILMANQVPDRMCDLRVSVLGGTVDLEWHCSHANGSNNGGAALRASDPEVQAFLTAYNHLAVGAPLTPMPRPQASAPAPNIPVFNRPAVSTPAQTNYTPWLLGGAAVLAVGALIYLKRRKR
jgi:hypothetical protein